MTRLGLALSIAALAAGACLAQNAMTEAEEEQLRRVVSDAGTSPVDFVRALEAHLARYPDSPRKADLERALTKAAIDAKDNRRIVLYGERVLERGDNDAQILERVSRALLAADDKESAEKALRYSRRLEQAVRAAGKEEVARGRERARRREDLDRVLARALVFQARATGNLGKPEEAVALARRSWDSLPTAEAAREAARWLARSDKEEEAVRSLAEAFTIADAAATDAQRALDRGRMGELYRKAKGSEKGLGDLVLEAYDRTTALTAARRLALREFDPNAELTEPLEFTLSGLGGEKLPLKSLAGKVLVMDFWATWCGPCRQQKPLYDEVKKRFRARPEVVFLAINTDEDRALVEPFLEEQKWSKRVWFEDGLSRALRISSIPTTIIFNRRGEVSSRMDGYVPERFVEMLAERIEEALKD